MSAVFVWKHTLWSDRTRHTQKAAGLASEASYSIKTHCVKRKCKTNHLWCWCRGGGKMSIIRISLQLPCSLVPGPKTKLPCQWWCSQSLQCTCSDGYSLTLTWRGRGVFLCAAQLCSSTNTRCRLTMH